jgi:hypothetical protein
MTQLREDIKTLEDGIRRLRRDTCVGDSSFQPVQMFMHLWINRTQQTLPVRGSCLNHHHNTPRLTQVHHPRHPLLKHRTPVVRFFSPRVCVHISDSVLRVAIDTRSHFRRAAAFWTERIPFTNYYTSSTCSHPRGACTHTSSHRSCMSTLIVASGVDEHRLSSVFTNLFQRVLIAMYSDTSRLVVASRTR